MSLKNLNPHTHLDRSLLEGAATALAQGRPLSDQERLYAVEILQLTSFLCANGTDVLNIYRHVMKKNSARIGRVFDEMELLLYAQSHGVRLDLARDAAEALRSGVEAIPKAVALLQEAEGLTQTVAQKKIAEIAGREFENVKSVCARAKRRAKSRENKPLEG
jgi:hypothetical protein